ncbi:MAG: hypothetical protein U0Q03_03190 [Acidimicrobiales bacterium]
MAAGSHSLSATERRLQRRVQALLDDGEQVQAAVVAFLGPRPGVESLIGPLAGRMSWPLTNARRRFVTVAVTNRGLVPLDNSSLRRPVRIRERFDSLDVLGPFNETVGDAWIEVNGIQYWIEGMWAWQLYAMRRLKSASGSTN